MNNLCIYIYIIIYELPGWLAGWLVDWLRVAGYLGGWVALGIIVFSAFYLYKRLLLVDFECGSRIRNSCKKQAPSWRQLVCEIRRKIFLLFGEILF